MSHENDRVRAVVWRENALELLDQRLLPGAERYRRLTSAAEVADAIREMVVRGAPAIGICLLYTSKPLSITTVRPSRVRLDSAIGVATMMRRSPGFRCV